MTFGCHIIHSDILTVRLKTARDRSKPQATAGDQKKPQETTVELNININITAVTINSYISNSRIILIL